MPVQFFIAFYRTGTPRKYHWVLTATSTSTARIPSPTHPIKTFEIMQSRILDSSGPEPTVRAVWERQDGKRTLLDSAGFMGVVAFPPCTDEDLTLESVYDVLDNLPALPPSIERDESKKAGWTCARWIVDILLEYGPIWGLEFVQSMQSETMLYYEIYKAAYKLEEGGWTEERSGEGEGRGVRCVWFPEEYVLKA